MSVQKRVTSQRSDPLLKFALLEQRSVARIRRHYLTEIGENGGGCTTDVGKGEGKERAKLIILAEVSAAARYLTTDSPGAVIARAFDAEVRVEGGRRSLICCRNQGTPGASSKITGTLDNG